MAAEDILVRIAISGQGDVISALGSVGEAGESAFSRLADSMGIIGKAAAGLALAVTGIGVGIFEFAKSAATAGHEVQSLATLTGASTTTISAMQGAMASAGVSTDMLGQSFRRMSMMIEQTWSEIQKAVKDRSDQIIDSQNAIVSSSQAMESSQTGLAEAQLSLQKLLAQRGMGPAVDPQVEANLKLQEAFDKVAEAQQKVAESAQKHAEAVKKAWDEARNAPETLATVVDEVAKGMATLGEEGAKAEINVSNIFKGLIVDASPAADAIKNLSANYYELGAAAPKSLDVLMKLSDFMKNSGDSTLNAALAARIFGRYVGTDMVDLMSKGSGALKEMIAEQERIYAVWGDTGERTKSLTDSYVAIARVSNDLVQSIHQIGTQFAPIFTEGLEGFATFLEDNQKAIKGFADQVVKQATPIIKDFFALLSGQQATNTTWMQPLANGLMVIVRMAKEAAEAVGAFIIGLTGADPDKAMSGWQAAWYKFGTTARAVMDEVRAAFRDVATDINKVFGTNLSGMELFVGAWALSVGAKLLGVGTIISTIAKNFNPWIAALTTVIALIGVIEKLNAKTPEAQLQNLQNRNTQAASAGEMSQEEYAAKSKQNQLDMVHLITARTQGDTSTESQIVKRVADETKAYEAADKDKLSSAIEANTVATQQNTTTTQDTEKAGSFSPKSFVPPVSQAATVPVQTGTPMAPFNIPPVPIAPIPGIFAGQGVGTAQQSTGGPQWLTPPKPETKLAGFVYPPETPTKSRATVPESQMGMYGGSLPSATEQTATKVTALGTAATETAAKLPGLLDQLIAHFTNNANIVPKQASVQSATQGQAELVGEKSINTAVDSMASSIVAGGQAILAALQSAASEITNFTPAGAAPQGHAIGGLLQGRGTGTSDSNLGLFSHNEYIHTAKAVEHYGVPFMDAINQMKLPKSSIGGLVNWASKFQLPKFAAGGHVNWNMGSLIDSLDMPRFASGGSVAIASPSRSSTEHFGSVDLRTDHGTFRMNASSDTMKSLSQASVDRKIRSGGNKPSHFR